MELLRVSESARLYGYGYNFCCTSAHKGLEGEHEDAHRRLRFRARTASRGGSERAARRASPSVLPE